MSIGFLKPISYPFPMMLLPRPHLCNRIASETAGVVFLRAPAGAGKSVLLETLAKELGAQICRTHQPQSDNAVNGNLLWDIPVFARAVRMPAPILESVRFVVIACRPDQRISGMARHILHHGSLTIGPEELALRPDEVDDLPSGQRRLALEDYAGWPAFLSLARLPDDTLCADYLRESYLPHLTPAQTVELSFWLENPSAAPDADWAMLLPPF